MIDRNTVQQILDTANIYDVVSDFVTLRRRGASWVGLCPFHNDRNPSFYVSPTRGICKCFSCGKGGSPVNFIMEHEQLSYPEALKWLARKYHIEVVETEMTDEERAKQDERESMLMINEWACQYFEKQLHETQQGRDIGMAYFNERGFNEQSIKEFKLGYSSDVRDALYQAAVRKGYNRDLLFKTGLCLDDGHGGVKDRFKGRVMFPIMNLAGSVIGFGGRTLSHDKRVPKYVNSPESIIYNKRNVLYGLYQARREISRQDKCFIVEGYADVISMHQSGFKNVIAASGTALTEGQIHAIHRFTSNATEMFDGDAAGLHAAMRGVDLLLSEGLNIKVLVLPPDDDPDSFARSHNATQIQEFIDANETDFIRFKANQLLGNAQNDPIRRTEAITEVMKSIALIPSEISRSVYAKECSEMFGIEQQVLLREIRRHVNENREQRRRKREREQLAQQNEQQGTHSEATEPVDDTTSNIASPPTSATVSPATISVSKSNDIVVQEREVIRLVIKYGMCHLCDYSFEDGSIRPITVIEYIKEQMKLDCMQFSEPLFAKTFNTAWQKLTQFYQDLRAFEQQADIERQKEIAELRQEQEDSIEGMDSSAIIHAMERREKAIEAKALSTQRTKIKEFRANYLENMLFSYPDDDIRNLSNQLAIERNKLSKIHTQFATIIDEIDRLASLVDEMLYNWKNAIVQTQIMELNQRIATAAPEEEVKLTQQLQHCLEMRRELSRLIGERVINPM